MSTIAKLGRNLQFSSYLRLITTLSYLFLVPFILKRVDSRLYGLNVLLLSIVGYFSLFDLGLTSGISRFTAKFLGEGKKDEMVDLMNIGIKVFTFLGIIASLSLFSLSFLYHKIFNIDEKIIQEGKILFYVYAFSSFFVLSNAPFKGILQGMQREDIVSKVGSLISLVNIPLAILVLTQYKSYLIYVFSFQFLTVILMNLNVYYVFKLLPHLKLKLSSISKPVYKQVMGFSRVYFLAGIFGIIIFQVDNLVIGTYLSLSAITMYSIAFGIHQQISALNSLLGSPFYYILTTEFAKKDNHTSRSIVADIAQMHIGILLPVLIIAIINIDHFVLAWVGEQFAGAIVPARILLSYWFLSITIEVLSQAVVGGMGKVNEIVKINGFIAAANLGLSLLLVRYIDINGVAIGTAIPFILSGLYYFFRFNRILSIPVISFFKKSIAPNIPHIFLSVVLSIIIHAFMSSPNLFEVLGLMGFCYGMTMLFAYALLSEGKKIIVKKIIKIRI